MWPVALNSGRNTNTADMSSRPDSHIQLQNPMERSISLTHKYMKRFRIMGLKNIQIHRSSVDIMCSIVFNL